jgi:hypothetical protein
MTTRDRGSWFGAEAMPLSERLRLRVGLVELFEGDVAAVLLQSMKSVGVLTKDIENGVRPGDQKELRVMTGHYLAMTFEAAGCRG